jgi:thioredoxin-like negative regulator of GroEL
MAEPAYVFDATANNFRALVLANSDKGPVVVNFWSPRAGPCLMLMSRLLKLADEFRGRFLLVRLDTDAFGRLAQLLEIARRDPSFRSGAGRNGLLALFGLLGEQDARTQRYRAALLNIAS